MYLDFFFVICAALFSQGLGNKNRRVATSEQNVYNFDVTGNDFQNTQTNKLCLLARLNASITFRYKVNSVHKQIEIPEYASSHDSFCDFDYVSQLKLNFDGISFTLVFERDRIDDEQPQQVYCNKCDNGHWRLAKIKVSADDMSKILHDAPPVKVIAETEGSSLSPTAAGGLISHISLQRGYRCSEQVLSTDVTVTDAYNIHTSAHSNENWTVQVHFNSINVQPFLVTNDIIKDPLLCKDVSVSIGLIITMPIVYFIFFIVCFRLKDKEVFKSWTFKFRKTNDKYDVSGTKPLLKELSFGATYPSGTSGKVPPAVSVTCTTPDEKKVNLI